MYNSRRTGRHCWTSANTRRALQEEADVFADLAKANPQLTAITVAAEPVLVGLAAPLDRLGVPGERFAYGSDRLGALAYALDEKWRGELPRTILFDGRGGKVALSGAHRSDRQ